jgi:hypothetical protein
MALSVFLVLGFLGNVVSGIAFVLTAAMMRRVENSTQDLNSLQPLASVAEVVHRKLLFAAFLCAVNVACLAGLWSWKKWGVIGYACASVLGTFVAYGVNPVGAVSEIFLLLLFGAAVAGKWSAFE